MHPYSKPGIKMVYPKGGCRLHPFMATNLHLPGDPRRMGEGLRPQPGHCSFGSGSVSGWKRSLFRAFDGRGNLGEVVPQEIGRANLLPWKKTPRPTLRREGPLQICWSPLGFPLDPPIKRYPKKETPMWRRNGDLHRGHHSLRFKVQSATLSLRSGPSPILAS